MFFLSETMKLLIVFALAFFTVSAKNLFSRSIEVSVLEKEDRITNGKKAAPGQFYYQVGLSLRIGSYFDWCGGSFIGSKWVLTAAHCTDGVSFGKVYLGATQRLLAEKVYNVTGNEIINHPHWDRHTDYNDISLIEIPSTPENDKMGTVRILSKHDPNNYVGFIVVMAGWGYVNDNTDQLSNDLYYGVMKVSPGSVCSEFFKTGFSDKTHICVSTPDRVSMCVSDSGGPLVLEGQSLQIGVASFGYKEGCTGRFPTAYTRVSAHLPWIRYHTGIDN